MSDRIKVALKVVRDPVTGITVHQFSWCGPDAAGDPAFHTRVDIANRPVLCQSGELPFAVLEYDEVVDGALGEARRAAIEEMVNGELGKDVQL